ncbi:MAG: ATP-binding protein [Burkholderiaceae bacterium]|nr:ATP-binding protein [Burkholderiaceae bacterium]
MPTLPKRLSWLKSALFWRTFFMLAFLIIASMAAWVASFHLQERKPLAQQIASQVVSTVTVTRAALTHSDPDLRRELLFDLASEEGIRIYLLEKTDLIELPPDDNLMTTIQASVRAKLGEDTKFAVKVNDIPGFWVSFKIAEDDEYWLMLESNRLQLASGLQWFGWAAVVLALSLVGAAVISRLISQPLAQLAFAARTFAGGQQPEPLPETGSSEVTDANRSFNQMVQDLERVESDRALILAGISHDLRTPLARMQLEIELARLSDAEKQGMQADIAQMDAIIGQFLDYAKATKAASFEPLDLAALLADAAHEAERWPDVRISQRTEGKPIVQGNATELRRVFDNLIENAHRYGKTQDTGIAEIDAHCRIDGNQAVIEIADHGAGVPPTEIERLLRPFTRLDTARGQANGAGLGLAIVNRVIQQHGGQLQLSRSESGGLSVRIMLPTIKTMP